MAEQNSGQAAPYRGPSGAFRDSIWLTQEDLPRDKDSTFVVEDVVLRKNVTFQGGREKPAIGTLKFKGLAREFGLNATNRKRMNTMFGQDTGGWIGKTVTLYFDPEVTMKGEKCGGLRIRLLTKGAA